MGVTTMEMDRQSVSAAHSRDIIISTEAITEDFMEEVILKLGFKGEVEIHQQDMSFGPDHRKRQVESKGRSSNSSNGNSSSLGSQRSAGCGFNLIPSAALSLSPFYSCMGTKAQGNCQSHTARNWQS